MKLHLYEELLLLALRDDKGDVPGSAWCKQAIAGALLAELMLEERLSLSADGKTVQVCKTDPMGDALLDESLALVRDQEKPWSLEKWMAKYASFSKLAERAAQGLCEKGVLSEKRSRVLWIFESCKFPELNHEPERLLLERLERTIFSDSKDVDARMRITLSLADKTGLLALHFDKNELKARREHLDALLEDEDLGLFAKRAIEAITAAIMVSTIIVPIVAT